MIRQPNEAFSTLTGLRKRGRTFQIAVRGEASHALELDKSAPTDYESYNRSADACVADFCLAFRDMIPDQTLTTVRDFSIGLAQALSWIRSYADLYWYPLRPIRTHCRCFLWLKRARGSHSSGEQVTSTTLVTILSLLQRTAAPSLCGGSR